MVWASPRTWETGTTLTGWTGVGLGLGLYLVEVGTLAVELAGTTWRLSPGDALLVPPELVRDRITALATTRWISLGLQVQLYGRLSLAPLLGGPHHWRPEPVLHTLASLIVDEWEDVGGRGLVSAHGLVAPHGLVSAQSLVAARRPKSPTARLIANGLARAVFGQCWRDLQTRSESVTLTHLDAPLWLWQALQQIRRAPDQDIAQLCQALQVSPAHLRRTFHRFLGQSPQSYLTAERLRVAQQLLLTTDQTVATIAVTVGFESLSHFTRLFTQHFLHPPARYRALLRSQSA